MIVLLWFTWTTTLLVSIATGYGYVRGGGTINLIAAACNALVFMLTSLDFLAVPALYSLPIALAVMAASAGALRAFRR